MKKYISILYIPLLFLFFACAQEDELTPSNIKENYFAPDENATDATSLLQKEFYKTEKSYLLFNDTLRHEPIGTKPNGEIQYFTETVDIAYAMTGYSAYQYTYNYLSTIEQKEEATQFIKDYILPHLSTKLRPFSWLLVNQILEYNIDYSPDIFLNDYKSVMVGKRCIAIAMENFVNLSESELKEQTIPLFISFLSNKMYVQPSETLKKFTQYGSSIYGANTPVQPITEEENMEYMKQAGFVEASVLWGFPFLGTYPSEKDDINAYIRLILTKTDEEIGAEYANYPTIITKANVIKSMILNLGYIY
ncbi:hypothetical protein [uncultured Bacteroides sp.]|uniref:hypothetical protein n=1 Tax=uncultured Bacteroides sp. TaxID=162156 RepID=UPI002AABD13B|nr:hypothetical protein [uncultured Bacteroides sp.]